MQGWSQTPGSYQNRIVFVFVMIAGMLLYWHWEAMVISYLAVRKIVLPYTSFEQLLSSSSDKVQSRLCKPFIKIHNFNHVPLRINDTDVFVG